MKNAKLKIWSICVLTFFMLVASAYADSVYQKAAGTYNVRYSEKLTVIGEFAESDRGTARLRVQSNKRWSYNNDDNFSTAGTYQIKGNRLIIAKTKRLQNDITNEILSWIREHYNYEVTNLSGRVTNFTITRPLLQNGKPSGGIVTIRVEGVGSGTYGGQKITRRFKFQSVNKIL